MTPGMRPPPKVWRSTSAKLGPGDIAPMAQIAANDSHSENGMKFLLEQYKNAQV